MARTDSMDALVQHDGFLRALARALLCEPALADDAVQEVWLVALRRQTAAAGAGADAAAISRPWLRRTLRNIASRLRRSASRRRHYEALAAARVVPAARTPADIVDLEATRAAVVRALLELDEPYRSTVISRYYEGKAPRVIAAEAQVPVETVRTRLKRGLATMRARLGGASEDGTQASVVFVMGLARLSSLADVGVGVGGLATTGAARVAPAWKVAAAACVVVAALVWVAPPGSFGGAAGPAKSGDAAAASANQGALGAAGSPGARSTDDTAGAEPAPIVVRPFATRHVRGTVTTRDGTPVAGASVLVSVMDASVTPILLTDAGVRPGVHPLTTTDATGAFAVGVDTGETVFSVRAEARGLAPGVIEAVVVGMPVRVVLGAAASMSGYVYDEAGRGLGGAVVKWWCMAGTSRIDRTAVCEPSGRYRLSHLPPIDTLVQTLTGHPRAAKWSATACAAGYALGFAEHASMPLDEAATARGDQWLDFVLTRGAIVRGVVRDAATGGIIAGAAVTAESTLLEGFNGREGGPPAARTHGAIVVGRTRTSAAGEFAFPAFAITRAEGGGSYERDGRRLVGRLVVAAEGYAPTSVSITANPDDVVVTADVGCRRPTKVEGRVVDDTGAPVAGADVHARHREVVLVWDPLADDLHIGTKTGPDGRFVLDGVPQLAPGATVELRAYNPRDDATASVSVATAAGEVIVVRDLVVARRAGVVVRVVDPAGASVAGAQVSDGEKQLPAVTDVDGVARVCMPDPSPKSVRLSVFARGFAPAVTEALTPVVDPDPQAAVTVQLEPPQTLSGTVLGGDSLPIAGARITVTARDALTVSEQLERVTREMSPLQFCETVRSGPDGKFMVTGLPRAECRVCATVEIPGAQLLAVRTVRSVTVGNPVRQTTCDPVPSDKRDLILRIAHHTRGAQLRRGTLEGSAVDDVSGEPVRDVAATLLENGAVVAQTGGPAQRFLFASAPEGTYTLRVGCADHAETDVPDVVIRADAAAAPVVVRLRRGITCRGVVRSAAGATAKGARLTLVERIGMKGKPVDIAADGSYAAMGLRPGRYHVTAGGERAGRFGSGPRVPRAEFAIVVPEGATEVNADIVLEDQARLTIAVTCPRFTGGDGLAIADEAGEAWVAAVAGSRGTIAAADGFVLHPFNPSGADGSWATIVAAGTLTIRVSVPGAPPEEKTVTIEPGAAATVKFDVP